MRATLKRSIVFLALLAIISAIPLGCSSNPSTPAATPAAAKTTAATTAAATSAASATTSQAATTSAAASSSAAAASTDAAKAFYKDKVLTIVVSNKAGAQNDVYARIMAPYLQELTGARVAIENKDSGGGLVAQNEEYRTVKPDGLTLLFDATGKMWANGFMKEKGIEYDINKFEYMSGIRGGSYLLAVAPKGQYTTVDALKKGKGLRVPTSTPTSILSLAAMGVSEVLGLDSKLVLGVGADPALLALQQGEAHFMVRPFDFMAKYQQQGQVKGLVQLGDKRDPLLPDLPTLGEVTTLNDSQKKLMSVLFPEAKLFMAPPGTPKDRVQYMDECITKVLNNPEVQGKIKDQASQWFGIYPASEVPTQLSTLSKNADIFTQYSDLIKKYVPQ
jgi:tripartite-type tricarboxylate transporter receptor subunit TctC